MLESQVAEYLFINIEAEIDAENKAKGINDIESDEYKVK